MGSATHICMCDCDVRYGVELSSNTRGKLNVGDRVEVLETLVLDSGQTCVRTSLGWITARSPTSHCTRSIMHQESRRLELRAKELRAQFELGQRKRAGSVFAQRQNDSGWRESERCEPEPDLTTSSSSAAIMSSDESRTSLSEDGNDGAASDLSRTKILQTGVNKYANADSAEIGELVLPHSSRGIVEHGHNSNTAPVSATRERNESTQRLSVTTPRRRVSFNDFRDARKTLSAMVGASPSRHRPRVSPDTDHTEVRTIDFGSSVCDATSRQAQSSTSSTTITSLQTQIRSLQQQNESLQEALNDATALSVGPDSFEVIPSASERSQ